eukprot:3651828-Rhodomonas_salina.1
MGECTRLCDGSRCAVHYAVSVTLVTLRPGIQPSDCATVFFCDIVGFTTISSGLETSEVRPRIVLRARYALSGAAIYARKCAVTRLLCHVRYRVV